MADHDTHDHTGVPGVGGSSDLDAIITASSGQDIADALAGAAAPDAGNVFATMADVGGGGGGDYIKIATTTLGVDTADITFTGISGSYRDLIASVNVRSTSGSLDNLFIRCGNGSIDTASHYGYYNVGTAGTTASLTTQIRGGIDTYSGHTAGVFASGEYTFYNYASTTLQKQIAGELHFYDYANNLIHYEDVHATWNQTSAIDQIRFYTSANLKAGSSITIYGRSI